MTQFGVRNPSMPAAACACAFADACANVMYAEVILVV
jgi:hypothetical protein